MNLTVIALSFLGLLILGYRFYGSWVAKQFGIDDGRKTPAHEVNDGVDFVAHQAVLSFWTAFLRDRRRRANRRADSGGAETSVGFLACCGLVWALCSSAPCTTFPASLAR